MPLFRKKAAIFTTTINKTILDWLNQEAKMQKITKRELIEKALVFYKTEMKRKAMIESFKRAAKDPEMIWMAEAGLSEWNELIKQYENETGRNTSN